MVEVVDALAASGSGSLDDASLGAHFREAMSRVATPVTVVTTLDGDRPHGTTVSAFASLSMSPPMVLVALDRKSELLALLRRTRRFGVNVLSSDQAGLAGAFARKGVDKFAEIVWVDKSGVPYIPGAMGFLVCAAQRFVYGGDHVVAFGVVLEVDAFESRPLTYHSRAFGTHTVLP